MIEKKKKNNETGLNDLYSDWESNTLLTELYFC